MVCFHRLLFVTPVVSLSLKSHDVVSVPDWMMKTSETVKEQVTNNALAGVTFQTWNQLGWNLLNFWGSQTLSQGAVRIQILTDND